MILSAVLFICTGESIFPQSQYEAYRHKEIGQRDGLINPKVLSICSDRYGYIWMGTEDGLTRFDGLNFTDYNSEETGLPSTRMVSHLFLDTNGILWCVTDNRFISYYSYEEDRFSPADTLPGNLKVTDFLVDNTLNIASDAER